MMGCMIKSLHIAALARRMLFCICLGFLLLSSLQVLSAKDKAATGSRPNILIIMADDCTYNDLPLYGGQNAKTPNIDRLASQGLTFNLSLIHI